MTNAENPSVSPEDAGGETVDDKTVVEIQHGMLSVFPEYTEIGRSGYDDYDPKNDPNDRGRILVFYTEQGAEHDKPKILFIFRTPGFVINYDHAPEPQNLNAVWNKHNSVYGRYRNHRHQDRWSIDQLDLALERTRIHREGILPESDAFRMQPAGWSEEEQRFTTMGERLDLYKRNPVPQNTLWNTLDRHPGKAEEFALACISQQKTYVHFNGTILIAEEVCRQIDQSTEQGRRAVARELNRIESCETLLRDKGILLLL